LVLVLGALLSGILYFSAGLRSDAVKGHFAALQYEDGITDGVREYARRDLRNPENLIFFTHRWHASGYQYFTYTFMHFLQLSMGASLKLLASLLILIGIGGWSLLARKIVVRVWQPWLLLLSLHPVIQFGVLPTDFGGVKYQTGLLLEWAALPWLFYCFLCSVIEKKAISSLSIVLLSAFWCMSFALKYSLGLYIVVIGALLLLAACYKKRYRIHLLISWALGGVIGLVFLQSVGSINFFDGKLLSNMPATSVKNSISFLEGFQAAGEVFFQLRWSGVQGVLRFLMASDTIAFSYLQACYPFVMAAAPVFVFTLSNYILIRALREAAPGPGRNFLFALGTCTLFAQGHFILFVLIQSATVAVGMQLRLLFISILLHVPVLMFLLSKNSKAPISMRCFVFLYLLHLSCAFIQPWQLQIERWRRGWSFADNRDLASGLVGFGRIDESDTRALEQFRERVPSDAVLVSNRWPVVFASNRLDYTHLLKPGEGRKVSKFLDYHAGVNCQRLASVYAFVGLFPAKEAASMFKRFSVRCPEHIREIDVPRMQMRVWLLSPGE
jgi:hypothetical protein